MNADYQVMRARADAYKWAYEYLQDRMRSIDRLGWAEDCDSEIKARIEAAEKAYYDAPTSEG